MESKTGDKLVRKQGPNTPVTLSELSALPVQYQATSVITRKMGGRPLTFNKASQATDSRGRTYQRDNSGAIRRVR